MHLHLGGVFRLHNEVRVFETLFDVAALVQRRPVHIALLRNILGSAATTCGAGLIRGSWKYRRSIGLTSHLHIDDKRLGIVLHLHQLRRLFRDVRICRRHRRDRLAGITHDGIATLLERRIAQHRLAQHMLNDVHALHARQFAGLGGVDRNNAGVREHSPSPWRRTAFPAIGHRRCSVRFHSPWREHPSAWEICRCTAGPR